MFSNLNVHLHKASVCDRCPARECHIPIKCEGHFVESHLLEGGHLEDCIKICNDNSLCQWYTLEKSNNHCVLYGDCAVAKDCDTCATGRKSCTRGYHGVKGNGIKQRLLFKRDKYPKWSLTEAGSPVYKYRDPRLAEENTCVNKYECDCAVKMWMICGTKSCKECENLDECSSWRLDRDKDVGDLKPCSPAGEFRTHHYRIYPRGWPWADQYLRICRVGCGDINRCRRGDETLRTDLSICKKWN